MPDSHAHTPFLFPPASGRWIGTLAILCWAASLSAPAHGKLEVVVPAYFYPVPNSPWDDLNSAADQVDLTAILNPSSGPGNSQDTNYVAAVDALRNSGGRVIGYVHTSYGARPLTDVLAEIDDYASWYNLDGIFIDEMANTGPAEKLNYYRDIYNHAKNIDSHWEVMGNPGTNTLEQYLTWPTADRFVITEDVGSQYASFAPAPWVANYQRSRFVHLIHTEPSSTVMQNDLAVAIGRNAGAIYITNDVLNNPWDTLPDYWQTELDTIAGLNASILAGDMDEDLDVDQDDLTRWSHGWSLASGAMHYDGDADADGDVDGRDFLVWQSQFGRSGSPAFARAATPIPEPLAVLLMAIAMFFGLAWRNFRCHP